MKTRARENPFASDRVEAFLTFEPEWLNQTWENLMDRLRQMDYRGSIIGPHGSGKTTLLSELKSRLLDRGYRVRAFFLNDEQRDMCDADWERLGNLEIIDGVNEKTIVFLDGAEQLSPWQWYRFKKMTASCSGLIITQHKVGKMPVWLETDTSLEMFRDFVERLSPGFERNDEVLRCCYLNANGNIREALWQCYDSVAHRNVV